MACTAEEVTEIREDAIEKPRKRRKRGKKASHLLWRIVCCRRARAGTLRAPLRGRGRSGGRPVDAPNGAAEQAGGGGGGLGRGGGRRGEVGRHRQPRRVPEAELSPAAAAAPVAAVAAAAANSGADRGEIQSLTNLVKYFITSVPLQGKHGGSFTPSRALFCLES